MTARKQRKQQYNPIGKVVTWTHHEGHHPIEGTVVGQKLLLEVQLQSGDKVFVDAAIVTIQAGTVSNGGGI
jgi:hypothetical protein